MMSISQESVKLVFRIKSLEFAGFRENFLIFFVINCLLAAILSKFLFYFIFCL